MERRNFLKLSGGKTARRIEADQRHAAVTIRCLLTLVAAVASTFLAAAVLSASDPEKAPHPLLEGTTPLELELQPGEGVTRVLQLSEYFPPLRNTAADTPVFILEGSEEGPVVMVAGGVHPSEPAGMLAAVALLERAEVQQGRLIVIPYANPLAVPADRTVTLVEDGEKRSFPHGNRRTLEHFHPNEDATEYVSPAGRIMETVEGRNLNRVWPGNAEGTPTEQLAHAIVEMMRTEGVQIAFDLHETTFPVQSLVWTLAATEQYETILDAACERVNEVIRLDLIRPRPADTPRGLSRTEWESATGAISFLTETSRAGATPMEVRIGIQLELVRAVLLALAEEKPDMEMTFERYPGFEDILMNGPKEPEGTGRDRL